MKVVKEIGEGVECAMLQAAATKRITARTIFLLINTALFAVVIVL